MKTADLINQPKVSIAVAAYNHEKYVGELLRSILNQTMPDFEIVIIDDGSPDATPKIIQSFADKHPDRIRFFRQENQGLVKTINKAFKMCRGNYVAPVGSDDIWQPDMLEALLKKMALAPDLSVVYADINLINPENEVTGRLHRSTKPCSGKITEDLWRTNFISGIAVMYKKELFEKFGYWDEQYSIGCDFEFLLRVSPYVKVGYVDKILASYRVHSTSSSLGNEKTGRESLAIRQEFIRKNPGLIKKSLRNRGYAHAYFLLAEANSINKNKKRAGKFYFKACRHNPFFWQAYFGWLLSVCGFNYFQLKQNIKKIIYDAGGN